MTEERVSPLRQRMIEDMRIRAYQFHMTEVGIAPPTFNVRIMALRFLFGTTCKREDMHQHMQFRRQPRRLPVVLSV